MVWGSLNGTQNKMLQSPVSRVIQPEGPAHKASNITAYIGDTRLASQKSSRNTLHMLQSLDTEGHITCVTSFTGDKMLLISQDDGLIIFKECILYC